MSFFLVRPCTSIDGHSSIISLSPLSNDTGCGKTSLVQALVQGSAPARPVPTVACSVHVKVKKTKEKGFDFFGFASRNATSNSSARFFRPCSFFQTQTKTKNSSSSAPPTTPPSRASSSSSSGTSAAAGEQPPCAGSFTATRRACCSATTSRGAALAAAELEASSARCSLEAAREGSRRLQARAAAAEETAAVPRPRGSTCGRGRPRSRRRGRSGPLSQQPSVVPLLSRRRLRCITLERQRRRLHHHLRRPCSPSRPCWWGQRRTRTRPGGAFSFFSPCFFPPLP